MFSLPRPLVFRETTLIDPGPAAPDDNDVMNEVVDVASTIAFYFGVRVPDDWAGSFQFPRNSELKFRLMRCLQFALEMYMRGKARGAGVEYNRVLGQRLRVWDLLQNKYNPDPVENAGQVSKLDDVLQYSTYVCM